MESDVAYVFRKVLKAIQSKAHLLEGAEVSLEVNPTSLETQTLREFREAGINRVSIGVQSLHAATLKLLNRDHSVKEAKNCLQAAQNLFPGRVSIDLMFGLPHHNTERYEVSNFACNQSAESIHNKGYWQGQQYIGIGPGAHSRVVPQVWKSAEKTTKQRDADHVGRIVKDISVKSDIRSNTSSFHSSTNEIAVSKNNNNMTCLTHVPAAKHRSEDSLCISTVAHHVIREARINASDPASWLQETLKKGNGIRKTEPQTRLVVASEYLASGLRTRKGVTAEQWGVFLPHLSPEEVFVGELGWLEDAGLVHLSPEGLRATEEGLVLLDAILPHLYNILYDHSR
ncbi:Radical S-adenosyl methionine domain-containing protein 1, mitochondrial [Portunus trituberculatus]|uniref:Radical S-adenosyl methionine domain-containing protein 1, mitochondrial n=1 Tax=Portunus trituberculatus TaxID=210409 RepID=A0A5B7F874_PORTR|nr:Radical S-adenosyl methionine domain-containing protein 1, mitochondrial [Portunus trituberculatus]